MKSTVRPGQGWVDIHCHLVPQIDDGASSVAESLEMAWMAVEEGIDTIVVTPHQLGNFGRNSATQIRQATQQLQSILDEQRVPLHVLPGADVRVEADLVAQVRTGEVMTLADHGRHLLLELPHEMYFDLLPLVRQLERIGIQSILSHPERNMGLLARPNLVSTLVEAGCLMQVTCGSLTGTFGPASQEMSEVMLQQGWVHFLATDAHGSQARRPRMRQAFDKVAQISGKEIAERLCRDNPRAVAIGEKVTAGTIEQRRRRRSWFGRQVA